ncbi:MAG: type II secretion system F family protein [Clostridiales bacterium]|nr:type II secretion system F family protein [Clostridiales bacterium]
MMTGFSEIRLFPLAICILISSFLYMIICIVIYRIKREKLLVAKRVENLPNREKPRNIKKAAKEKKSTKKNARIRSYQGMRIFELLGEKLALAGIMLKPEEFIGIWCFIIFFPALIGYLITLNYIVAAGLGIIGAMIPIFYIRSKYTKRMTLFTNQLGDSLTIMSNCLRSGLSLQQAMVSISKEMPEPISKEFSRVLREIKYGSTIEDALNGLVARIKSKDLELMVSAILIQRQVGGNLSEILNNISSTILSRIKIQNDIKVMTATGRVSGIIVGLLPLGVGLILMVLNPEYFQVFFETQLGIGLLILCALMEGIGFFCISKIIKIDY